MTNSDLAKIFTFLDTTNRLKFELRYGEKASGAERDSTAAHSWHLALLAYMIGEKLSADGMKIDMLKVLKLSLVQDMPEAFAGNTPFDSVFAAGGRDSEIGRSKAEKEIAAMEKLAAMLPESLGAEMLELYKDYAAAGSLEAKLVVILDKLEAAHHEMFMGIGTGLPDVDPCILHSNRGYGWVPEFDRLIEHVRDELRADLAKNGIEWKPEYDLRK